MVAIKGFKKIKHKIYCKKNIFSDNIFFLLLTSFMQECEKLKNPEINFDIFAKDLKNQTFHS